MSALFLWIAAFMAVIIYSILIRQILRREIEQNFATYLLWGALNAITLVTLVRQGGNYAEIAVWTVCSLSAAYAIYRIGTFKWEIPEHTTLGLVILCCVVWAIWGNKAGTIASTLAIICAGIPQTWDVWKNPYNKPLWTWIGFIAANSLAAAAGKDWSVEERFYPVACSVFCAIPALLTLRKWLRKRV